MGYALPTPGMVYRMLGATPPRGHVRRLGCGVMDKSGYRDDQINHRQVSWSLVWILRGAGSYTDAQGRSWSLTAGDAFQRWPDQPHSTRCDPASGWREIFLDLGMEAAFALGDLGVLRRDLPVWHVGTDPVRLERWLRLRERLAAAPDRELPALCVELQALAQEATARAGNPADEDRIDQACRLLAEEAAGRDELQSFCAAHGLNYEAFRKRFRRRTGMSPGQYRIRRRVERACALLQTTRTSIAAIAADLGYASPFEFSTQFRQHLGVSPRAYRGR